jgi:hypothetical protein
MSKAENWHPTCLHDVYKETFLFIPSLSFSLHMPPTALYIPNGGTSEVMRKAYKLFISELFNFFFSSRLTIKITGPHP